MQYLSSAGVDYLGVALASHLARLHVWPFYLTPYLEILGLLKNSVIAKHLDFVYRTRDCDNGIKYRKLKDIV